MTGILGYATLAVVRLDRFGAITRRTTGGSENAEEM